MIQPADSGLDIEHLQEWQGRSETSADLVTAAMTAGLRATLDQPPGEPTVGEAAPLGIHWCLALQRAPMSALGPDGHPARGGFLPPVPLPRRMWAGGRLRFADAIRVGDAIERVSTVKSVTFKEGRTGPLVFIVVEHRISTPRGLALAEEHDIVFRALESPAAVAAAPAPVAAPPPDISRIVEPSPVLLFRYSALTFNGHRIHYDRTYTTEVEGYPGLIVHGPLQATLLMHAAVGVFGGSPAEFAFRAERPLFDLAPFTVEGRRTEPGTAALRVVDAEGRTTMSATARTG